MMLIPVLDVLQSVPILGYLSFTVVFFVWLFPNRRAGTGAGGDLRDLHQPGLEHGVQLLRVLTQDPLDLDEASRSFRVSPWQRFWRLEVPFAMPGLIWNMMMSMSGGWFFVVAAEAISVGDLQNVLPGVGSYVARAIQERDLAAIAWAMTPMTVDDRDLRSAVLSPDGHLGRQVSR